MYIYKQGQSGLWIVGYYTPKGTWVPESFHSTKEDAINWLRYLNGADVIDNTIPELSEEDKFCIEKIIKKQPTKT